MWKPFKELKNKHKGEDIYVVGSGYSVNFFNKSFFENKIVIGINYMPMFIKSTYCFCKDFGTIEEFKLIMSMLDSCEGHPILIAPNEGWGGYRNPCVTKYEEGKDYYICDVKPISSIDSNAIGSDIMCQTWISASTAMCIANYLGAKNIILVGLDSGMLDGKSNINGYYPNKFCTYNESAGNQGIAYSDMGVEANIIALRNLLCNSGVNVYSLNPFINIGLEGHTYKKVFREVTQQIVTEPPKVETVEKIIPEVRIKQMSHDKSGRTRLKNARKL